MKTVAFLLFLLPVPSLAQTIDSLVPHPSISSPLSMTASLKPIEFREIPYLYTTQNSSYYRGYRHTSYSTNTGLQRIYTYDGIDVVDPEKTLWPTLLAVNNPDVEWLRTEFDDIVARKQTAVVMGTLLMVPGFIMMVAGELQNRDYKQQVAKQNTSYYTVMQTTTTYTTRTCSIWSGSANGQGTTKWTCSSDPSWTYVGSSPPFSQQVPTTTTVPVTRQAASSPVTVSDGKGLMIAGLVSSLVGVVVFCSARGDRHGTFLRAVQYYNRSLNQKVSWELLPYSTLGTAGPSLVVRF